MRLLNTETLEVVEFMGDSDIPPYAILSHTWGEQECSIQDMEDPNVSRRRGYKKIRYCCRQAKEDSYKWAWVDT
jgi:hypothetical protein